jgi:tRNA dimethylallyltransferase
LRKGLEQEVKGLSAAYGWECEALKGIGYREWQQYFGGTQSLAVTRERIIAATLALAKRQRTWFKRSNDIVWISDYAAARSRAEHFLSN